ncbi:OsmC family peroxiredoxin [Persicobacter diffluens]|uniref:Peroxiredoxin n=1 Tax=Persicobacter diffluens TaxID=981 RepID=A0AAN4W2L5_9BACT|nr:peroxiredoxin [Persicobacter diffluens]
MNTNKAKAQWTGTLKEGKGTMQFTGYEGPYTFASRFENGAETNPEELVGAAIAGCFSMFISALISEEKLSPESIDTKATVILDGDDIGPKISSIALDTTVKCTDLTSEKFEEIIEISKAKCPISRLYTGGSAEIEVKAELL